MKPSRLSFFPGPLTLGTVQLGIPYGIANASGQPTQLEAVRILRSARKAGITTFDTARAYGTSEERIGEFRRSHPELVEGLAIITKCPALDLSQAADPAGALARSLATSAEALGLPRLGLVLAHRGADLLDGRVEEAFAAAVDSGKLEGFGASLYDPELGLVLLRRIPGIVSFQLPIHAGSAGSALDELLAEASRRGIVIFARSVFAQGALLMSPAALPDYLAQLAAVLNRIDGLARRLGATRATLLLKAVVERDGVDSAVIGVDRVEQVTPHVAAIATPPIGVAIRDEVRESFAEIPPTLLDPTRWPKRES